MNVDHSDGFVEIGDMRLHYVAAGAGPLVVLVHGFPSCWVSFTRQIEDLATDHHVIALDALGANLSSKPDDLERYRIEHLVAQVDAVARHVSGDERFGLVGHDWGAVLAWTFARALPHRLHGLVAISAPPYDQLVDLLRSSADQRARSSYMWRMREGEQHRFMTGDDGRRLWEYIHAPLRGLPGYDDSMDAQLRDAFAVPGAIDAGINWYRANIPPVDALDGFEAWPPGASRVSVPALQIWGDDDETFSADFVDGLADYADDVTVRRMPGTKHWPMIEHPAEVNRLLRDFFTRTITSR